MSVQPVQSLIHGKPSAREQRWIDARNAELDARAAERAARAPAPSLPGTSAVPSRTDGEPSLFDRVRAVLADRRARSAAELLAELPPGTKRVSVASALTRLRVGGTVRREPGKRVDGRVDHRTSLWSLA